ncbi:protein NTM1-like 9 isoform X1 [Punica granatum]|uniref:Protein NTM1-like 9 isoform X1 n=1 Tax=Punica granatum TaxID=22663 RepID=A0A6P8C056_PUNGR|nr:protein NTM1-like 9 isoform X1 [Punica granatum]XP_031376002.1 protein NTM1-like 9 isoform X1 [Punica granatum]
MDVPHIPGLDFDPSSIQLLAHYLKQRILDHFHSGDPNYSTNHHLIPDIELYNWDPEELPRQYDRLAEARSNGRQWFFFCLRKEKYRNNNRSKRIVPNAGYWKITSSDKKVKSKDTGEEIGKKKALTFYQGRSSSGITTNWGMHEYYLNPSYLGYNIEDMPFVVCHVFKRNGRRGGDDVESASYANDDSGHPATSESRAPTQEAAPNEVELS